MVVFLIRYFDLFMYFVSVYNTIMKIAFIGVTGYTIYLMRFKWPFNSVGILRVQGFGNLGDTFKHYLIYPAAFLLALILNHQFSGIALSLASVGCVLLLHSVARSPRHSPSAFHALPLETR